MEGMTDENRRIMETATGGAEARLAAFVAASLAPPVADPLSLRLWAGFLHRMQGDAEMLSVHEAQYLAYRDLLQSLIAALPRRREAPDLRADAIACNGVIDGLWLEGCALPEAFAEGELAGIGVRSVGAILGLDLVAHWRRDPP